MEWFHWVFIGLVGIGLLVFLFLILHNPAKKRTHIDQYQIQKDKIKTRKTETEKAKAGKDEPKEEGISISINSIFMGIFGLGVVIFVGLTVLNSLQTNISQDTTMMNVSNSPMDTIASFSSPFLVIIIVIAVILILFKIFSSVGLSDVESI